MLLAATRGGTLFLISRILIKCCEAKDAPLARLRAYAKTGI